VDFSPAAQRNIAAKGSWTIRIHGLSMVDACPVNLVLASPERNGTIDSKLTEDLEAPVFQSSVA
jgi:hypothetical protein